MSRGAWSRAALLPGMGLGLVLVAAAGCGHAPAGRRTNSAALEAHQEPAATAAQAEAKAKYDQGQNELRRGTYAEALKTFEEVRASFPYSPYAALAELAQGDTYFREARFIEATDAYRTFLRFHPAHAEVRYALGQVAESQYAQLPESWWFMPPVAEKDPAVLHQAIDAYDDFLRRFPDGRSAERARKNRTSCQQKLASHELYVARFYYQRKLWAGARSRALNLLATYPKLSSEPETLWLAGSAASHLGDAKAAHELLGRLLQDYPHAAEAKRARVLQARIPWQEPES